MYNGLGLRTPRGSGTNGYVQRNLSFAKPKTPQYQSYQYSDPPPKPARKPSAELVLHRNKRQIEVECLEYEEKLLESKQHTLEEVKAKVAQLRKDRLDQLEKTTSEQ